MAMTGMSWAWVGLAVHEDVNSTNSCSAVAAVRRTPASARVDARLRRHVLTAGRRLPRAAIEQPAGRYQEEPDQGDHNRGAAGGETYRLDRTGERLAARQGSETDLWAEGRRRPLLTAGASARGRPCACGALRCRRGRRRAGYRRAGLPAGRGRGAGRTGRTGRTGGTGGRAALDAEGRPLRRRLGRGRRRDCRPGGGRCDRAGRRRDLGKWRRHAGSGTGRQHRPGSEHQKAQHRPKDPPSERTDSNQSVWHPPPAPHPLPGMQCYLLNTPGSWCLRKSNHHRHGPLSRARLSSRGRDGVPREARGLLRLPDAVRHRNARMLLITGW